MIHPFRRFNQIPTSALIIMSLLTFLTWISSKPKVSAPSSPQFLSQSSDGCNRNVISLYKSLVRFVSDYGSLSYGLISGSHFKLFDTVRNLALCIPKGAFRTSIANSFWAQAGNSPPLRYRTVTSPQTSPLFYKILMFLYTMIYVLFNINPDHSHLQKSNHHLLLNLGFTLSRRFKSHCICPVIPTDRLECS